MIESSEKTIATRRFRLGLWQAKMNNILIAVYLKLAGFFLRQSADDNIFKQPYFSFQDVLVFLNLKKMYEGYKLKNINSKVN